MKKLNQNYVFIPIFLLAIIILSLKGTTSFDKELTVIGMILFTVFWIFILLFNRSSKRKMLLAITGYVVLMGIYFINR